jgi:signal transduction histidine kinase
VRFIDRFWRGSGAAGTSGSGIGLAVVWELIHAHGGQVRVDSRVGEGTTVTARLPLAGGYGS